MYDDLYKYGTIANETNFEVIPINGFSNDRYIHGGNVFEFKFLSNENILENELFTIRIFSGVQDIQSIEIETPKKMVGNYTILK